MTTDDEAAFTGRKPTYEELRDRCELLARESLQHHLQFTEILKRAESKRFWNWLVSTLAGMVSGAMLMKWWLGF